MEPGLLPDDLLELCMLASQSEVTVRTWAQVNRQAAACAKRVLARADFPPTRLALRYVGYCKPSPTGKNRFRPRASPFRLGKHDYNLIMCRTILPQLEVGLQLEGRLDDFALIRGKVYLEGHTGLQREVQVLGPALFTGRNPLHLVIFDLHNYVAREDLYIVELYLEVLLEGTDYLEYLRHRPPQTRAKLLLL